MASTLQDWVMELPMQMQGVLISAVRGADGGDNVGAHKALGRHYRRSIMNSAVEARALDYDELGGGKFMAPIANVREQMEIFISDVNIHPHHYYIHFMFAAEITGHYHPVKRFADDWAYLYELMCRDMHVNPETRKQLEYRLGDLREPELYPGSKESFIRNVANLLEE